MSLLPQDSTNIRLCMCCVCSSLHSIRASVVVYITPWIRALPQNVMLVRAVNEILRHLKELTIYFCVHMILPVGFILSEMILTCTFIPFKGPL